MPDHFEDDRDIRWFDHSDMYLYSGCKINWSSFDYGTTREVARWMIGGWNKYNAHVVLQVKIRTLR